MSRDSSPTYVHMRASRFADLFEEFCRPPSSTGPGMAPGTSNSGNANLNNGSGHVGIGSSNAAANNVNTGDPSMTQVPGHYLPFEEIQLPPHLMPINPEDEDDVVPDMHAAFSIDRALGQGSAGAAATGEGSGAGVHREPAWRDLGLEKLLDNVPKSGGNASGTATRREGKRTGLLLMR